MSRSFANYKPQIIYSEEDYQRILHAIRFIAGGLAFQTGVSGNDPFSGVDVEAMFNAADLLERRASLESAPFISSWHHMLELIEAPRHVDILNASSIYHSRLERFINRRNTGPGDSIEALATAITVGSSRQKINTFSVVKQTMVALLKDIVWLNPDEADSKSRTAYLGNLVSYCIKNKFVITTLNYDNTVELAASYLNIQVDRGLSKWNESSKLFFEPEKIKLLKLHGSIDWQQEFVRSNISRPIEHFKIIEKRPEKNSRPSLIFGHRNKLTADGPYLDLLMEFKEELSKADVLNSIGYSFRDEHINLLLMDWINSSDSRKIKIFNGPDSKAYVPFFTGENDRFLTTRITNTGLRAEDGFKNL